MHNRASPALGRPLSFVDHNQTVPADAGLDVCQCPACRGVNRGPDALAPVMHRGPVQCEMQTLDPFDAAAHAEIEGSSRQ